MKLMDTFLAMLGVHPPEVWPGPAKTSEGDLSRPKVVTLPKTLKTEPRQWRDVRTTKTPARSPAVQRVKKLLGLNCEPGR